MELVNDIYWVYSIDEAKEPMEECQRKRFDRFVKYNPTVDLDNGQLGIYKHTLNKFYAQFGYNYWDRINES